MAKIQSDQLFDCLVNRLCKPRDYEIITHYSDNSYKNPLRISSRNFSFPIYFTRTHCGVVMLPFLTINWFLHRSPVRLPLLYILCFSLIQSGNLFHKRSLITFASQWTMTAQQPIRQRSSNCEYCIVATSKFFCRHKAWSQAIYTPRY